MLYLKITYAINAYKTESGTSVFVESYPPVEYPLAGYPGPDTYAGLDHVRLSFLARLEQKHEGDVVIADDPDAWSGQAKDSLHWQLKVQVFALPRHVPNRFKLGEVVSSAHGYVRIVRAILDARRVNCYIVSTTAHRSDLETTHLALEHELLACPAFDKKPT